MANKSETNIVVADIPGVFNLKASAAGNFLRRVQAAVQEYERDQIVHRLQEGLHSRRAGLQRANPKNNHIKFNGRKSLLEKTPLTTGQRHQLKAVCKGKKCGAFGWRPLAY